MKPPMPTCSRAPRHSSDALYSMSGDGGRACSRICSRDLPVKARLERAMGLDFLGFSEQGR